MFDFRGILPETVDNNYHGNKIAFYAFALFTAIMTLRSLLHMFFEDAGLTVVAGIIPFEGNPDPDKVLHLFGSLWGFQQVIFCLICTVVLFRYRSLTSFMCLLFLIEWTTRFLLYPSWRGLPAEFYINGTPPPGAVGAPFVTLLLLVIFVFTLSRNK